MALPITERSRTDAYSRELYITSTYEVQRPPYDLQLTFSRLHNKRLLKRGPVGEYILSANENTDMWVKDSQLGRPILQAENKSYNKVVAKLGDASQLGSTLTSERRATWSTLVTILERALRAARSIKRMNFSSAARDLGLPYREVTVVKRRRVSTLTSRGRKTRVIRIKQTKFDWGTGRMRIKTLANGWLMYSYGVKPLAEDAYNAVDILQRPFPWSIVSGNATVKSHLYQSGPYSIVRMDGSASVRQSIHVRVDNPNLWLANRLGLVNPAQWILEGIPFSFVVDWFSNLSDVVNSFTDFVGLETWSPLYNMKFEVVHDFTAEPWAVPSQSIVRYTWTRRTRDFITPKIHFAYERFQWQRGANAISLLVGLLRSR